MVVWDRGALLETVMGTEHEQYSVHCTVIQLTKRNMSAQRHTQYTGTVNCTEGTGILCCIYRFLSSF